MPTIPQTAPVPAVAKPDLNRQVAGTPGGPGIFPPGFITAPAATDTDPSATAMAPIPHPLMPTRSPSLSQYERDLDDLDLDANFVAARGRVESAKEQLRRATQNRDEDQLSAVWERNAAEISAIPIFDHVEPALDQLRGELQRVDTASQMTDQQRADARAEVRGKMRGLMNLATDSWNRSLSADPSIAPTPSGGPIGELISGAQEFFDPYAQLRNRVQKVRTQLLGLHDAGDSAGIATLRQQSPADIAAILPFDRAERELRWLNSKLQKIGSASGLSPQQKATAREKIDGEISRVKAAALDAWRNAKPEAGRSTPTSR
jgi:hypothetical protein